VLVFKNTDLEGVVGVEVEWRSRSRPV